jgi:hypothetical protein
LEISQREDEQDLFIAAEFAFDRIEDFTEIDEFDDMPMTYVQTGGQSTFRMVISEGHEAGASDSEADPEMKAMLEQMFAGYELVVIVNAPKRIASHSLGELSADSRSVRYSLPILDMEDLAEETALTVTW